MALRAWNAQYDPQRRYLEQRDSNQRILAGMLARLSMESPACARHASHIARDVLIASMNVEPGLGQRLLEGLHSERMSSSSRRCYCCAYASVHTMAIKNKRFDLYEPLVTSANPAEFAALLALTSAPDVIFDLRKPSMTTHSPLAHPSNIARAPLERTHKIPVLGPLCSALNERADIGANYVVPYLLLACSSYADNAVALDGVLTQYSPALARDRSKRTEVVSLMQSMRTRIRDPSNMLDRGRLYEELRALVGSIEVDAAAFDGVAAVPPKAAPAPAAPAPTEPPAPPTNNNKPAEPKKGFWLRRRSGMGLTDLYDVMPGQPTPTTATPVEGDIIPASAVPSIKPSDVNQSVRLRRRSGMGNAELYDVVEVLPNSATTAAKPPPAATTTSAPANAAAGAAPAPAPSKPPAASNRAAKKTSSSNNNEDDDEGDGGGDDQGGGDEEDQDDEKKPAANSQKPQNVSARMTKAQGHAWHRKMMAAQERKNGVYMAGDEMDEIASSSSGDLEAARRLVEMEPRDRLAEFALQNWRAYRAWSAERMSGAMGSTEAEPEAPTGASDPIEELVQAASNTVEDIAAKPKRARGRHPRRHRHRCMDGFVTAVKLLPSKVDDANAVRLVLARLYCGDDISALTDLVGDYFAQPEQVARLLTGVNETQFDVLRPARAPEVWSELLAYLDPMDTQPHCVSALKTVKRFNEALNVTLSANQRATAVSIMVKRYLSVYAANEWRTTYTACCGELSVAARRFIEAYLSRNPRIPFPVLRMILRLLPKPYAGGDAGVRVYSVDK